MDTDRIKVWDIALRIFHWSLVFFFVLTYITGDELENVHAYSGYVILALLVFRIIWGFIGGKYARFWHFIYGKKATLAYARSLFSGKPQHYLGHNPIAGWMTVFMLLFLGLTVWSGLEAYAGEGKGPLAQDIQIIQQAYADDDEKHEGKQKEGDEFWEEIHEFLANITLLLIFFHIGGVLFSSLLHHENLIKAMITGYKKLPPEN